MHVYRNGKIVQRINPNPFERYLAKLREAITFKQISIILAQATYNLNLSNNDLEKLRSIAWEIRDKKKKYRIN